MLQWNAVCVCVCANITNWTLYHMFGRYKVMISGNGEDWDTVLG